MPISELCVERGELELRGWSTEPPSEGERAVLCLHETASSADVWRPLADALAGRATVHAYDRRGWGRSLAPAGYRRTTVPEHAADAEAVIDSLGERPLTLCGAGFGAIVALELTLRRRDLVSAALLVEPPILALVSEATPLISADVEAIRRTTAAATARLPDTAGPGEAAEQGARAALELFRGGALGALGAGAERAPEELAAGAIASPFALFAEIAATSGWQPPLAELPGLSVPVTVAVARSTPPIVRRAAEALARRLPDRELRELPGRGLPQLDAADELASLVLESG